MSIMVVMQLVALICFVTAVNAVNIINNATVINNGEWVEATINTDWKEKFYIVQFNTGVGHVEFSLHNVKGVSHLNAYHIRDDDGSEEFEMTRTKFHKLLENNELVMGVEMGKMAHMSFHIDEENDITHNSQYVVIISSLNDNDVNTFTLHFTYDTTPIQSSQQSGKIVFYQDTLTLYKQREFRLNLEQYKHNDVIEVALFPFSGSTSMSIRNDSSNNSVANIEKMFYNSYEKIRFVKNDMNDKNEQYITFDFNVINSGYFLLTHSFIEINTNDNREIVYIDIPSTHIIHIHKDISNVLRFETQAHSSSDNVTFHIESAECTFNLNSTSITDSFHMHIHSNNVDVFALEIALNAFINDNNVNNYCACKITTTSTAFVSVVHENVVYETTFTEDFPFQQYTFPFIFVDDSDLLVVKTDISVDINVLLTFTTSNSFMQTQNNYNLIKSNEFMFSRDTNARHCILNQLCTLNIKAYAINTIPRNNKMNIEIVMSNHFIMQYLQHSKLFYYHSYISTMYFYSYVNANVNATVKLNANVHGDVKYACVSDVAMLTKENIIKRFEKSSNDTHGLPLSERDMLINSNNSACVVLIQVTTNDNNINEPLEYIDVTLRSSVNDAITIPLNYTLHSVYTLLQEQTFNVELPLAVKQFYVNAQGAHSEFYISDANETSPCCGEAINKHYTSSSMIVFNVDDNIISNDYNVNLRIIAKKINNIDCEE